jgi:hypothetical protein
MELLRSIGEVLAGVSYFWVVYALWLAVLIVFADYGRVLYLRRRMVWLR